jgi:hypothetical protein
MTIRIERQKVIEAWMVANIGDGGIERYDDLHIDRIDEHWARREQWLQGGLEAFRLALGLRDQHRLAPTVALAYSLRSGEEPLGANFRTPDEFHAQLDWSPPSLYLFDCGREPWPQSDGVVVQLIDVNILFATSLSAKACYYMEFKQTGSIEYSRSVFVTG